MAIKDEKFFIARWVQTNPGGGVAITGFVEYNDEVVKQPNGTIKVYKATKPTCITVIPITGEEGAVVKYNKQEIELEQGEFIVANNSNNVEKLKYRVREGHIIMRDWDLQHEFLGEDAPDQIEEIVTQDEPKELDLTPKKSTAAKQKKKQHQGTRKTHATTIKELRLRPKTDIHDLGVKMRKARQFLEDGHRVIINMLFRGREMALREMGAQKLLQLAEELSDIAKLEKEPTSQGRRTHIVLAPK